MRHRPPLVAILPLLVAVSWLASCARDPRDLQIRTFSKSFEFRIKSDPMPPRAREAVLYRVTVIDKETGQPVEGGEGRIFANNEAGASTWDSFTPAQAVGTYLAKLRYVSAEEWAVGIEFRRDTLPGTLIERATDWRQDVAAATP
jgi:hypothetical protein